MQLYQASNTSSSHGMRFEMGATDTNRVWDLVWAISRGYPTSMSNERSNSTAEIIDIEKYRSPVTRKTEKEFAEYLLKSGFMSQLPDLSSYKDDPEDQPIALKGEPLSKTIMHDRR